MAPQPPPPGVYVPVPSFYMNQWNGDPDLDTFRRHLSRLVEGGITGVILNTHHGEGLHNCTGERKQFLDTAVETLRGKGTHVLVECSRESLWETVEKVDEAYKGGAEWGVISVPRVYGDVLRLEDVFGYFKQASEWSDIPLIVRMPPSTSSLAFTPDFVKCLSQTPNIVGIITSVSAPALGVNHRSQTDFTFISSSTPDGTKNAFGLMISPLANLVPGVVVEAHKTARAKEGLQQAAKIEGMGVVALKYALNRFCGYGGTCRPPLPEPNEEVQRQVDSMLSGIFTQENQTGRSG